MAEPKKKLKPSPEPEWPEGKPWEAEALKPKPSPKPSPTPRPKRTLPTTPPEEAGAAAEDVEGLWGWARTYFTGKPPKRKKRPGAEVQKEGMEE